MIAAGGAAQQTRTAAEPTPALRPYIYGSIYPNVVDYRGVPPGIEMDALYHPGETVPLAQVVAESAQRRVDLYGGSLSRAELESVLEVAGWPEELRAQAAEVAWCESRWSPYAAGDGSSSLGLFQLWEGWFRYAGLDVEQWHDGVNNARAALAVVRRDIALGRDPWTQWTCKPSR